MGCPTSGRNWQVIRCKDGGGGDNLVPKQQFGGRI